MEIDVLNPKEEIRIYIVNKFIRRRRSSLIIDMEKFLDFLDEMVRTSPQKFNIFMSAIINDVYEALKWKQTLNVKSDKEMGLLKLFDDVQTMEEAINLSLSEENVNIFLANIYCAFDQSLSDRINSKNNFNNVKVNDNIKRENKLGILDDFYFHNNKFIFDKQYKKEDYLSLYDSLLREYADDTSSMNGFVDIIYGISLYNESNYEQLVLDMCTEFLFQKGVVGDLDKSDCEEDYLFYMIKDGDLEHIMRVVTENRNIMEALAMSYASYDYYGDIREQLNNADMGSEIRESIKKLRKGKNK